MRKTSISVGLGSAGLALGLLATAPGPLVGATTPIATTPVGADESLGQWVVLGTRRGGRDLLIGDPSYPDSCHEARVDLIGADDARVRVRLVHVVVRTPVPGDVCDTKDVDATISPIEVKLPGRLAGRSISGPKKASLEKFASRLNGARGKTTFDLVGLRLADARTNLHAFGVKDRDIIVKGPQAGYVVALKPKLPQGLKSSRPVTVVTRSR